jgi:hypothetical protein
MLSLAILCDFFINDTALCASSILIDVTVGNSIKISRPKFLTSVMYEMVSESSWTIIVLTASVKEDEREGQGHTSERLLYQSAM